MLSYCINHIYLNWVKHKFHQNDKIQEAHSVIFKAVFVYYKRLFTFILSRFIIILQKGFVDLIFYNIALNDICQNNVFEKIAST